MKFLLALILSVFLASQAFAVVTFDAETLSQSNGTTSVSFNHTVGGGCSNVIVPVSAVFYGNSISAFTIGGSAATVIGSAAQGGSGARQVDMRYRVGLSGTVAIAVTLSGTTDTVSVSARSYCGAHQSTSIGTAVTSNDLAGGAPSVVVTSASGELVIDAVMVQDIAEPEVISPDSGQTARTNTIAAQTGYWAFGESDEAGAASVTMSWTITSLGSTTWAIIGVPLKPAAVAGGGAKRRIVTQ